MNKTELFPMNLQFFAEGDAGTAGTTGTAGTEGANGQTTGSTGTAGGVTGAAGVQDPQQNSTPGATEKTFTQAELSATAAREKAQGKASVYKMLGVTDEKEAKAQVDAFKQWQESQKTAEQKKLDAEKLATSNDARAIVAENKLACVMAGVTAESLDDALAIATLKVTDGKDLNAVLTEMKAQAKYAGFFTNANAGSGTGNPADHHNNPGGSKPENIGKRLAEAHTARAPKKSSYFQS